MRWLTPTGTAGKLLAEVGSRADVVSGEPSARRPRVLIVSLEFFGYEGAIAEEFCRQGFDVVLENERPSSHSVVKAILRVWPAPLARQIRRHYARIRADLLGKPLDLAILVKGEVVPSSFIEALRQDHPGAVIAFYDFDSFRRNPRGLVISKLVDHAFSFDPVDVAEHEHLTYKPLFHAHEFTPLPADVSPAYDISFVGTVHSGRYAIAQQVFRASGNNYGFFYSPAFWHHLLERLLKPAVRRIPRGAVSFEKLSRDQVADVFRRSTAVLDVQRNQQAGLTMRTFEVLASGACLITTNQHIVNEPFFDPEWILILSEQAEEHDVDSISRFVRTTPSTPRPIEPDGRYALAQWVAGFAGLVTPAGFPSPGKQTP